MDQIRKSQQIDDTKATYMVGMMVVGTPWPWCTKSKRANNGDRTLVPQWLRGVLAAMAKERKRVRHG